MTIPGRLRRDFYQCPPTPVAVVTCAECGSRVETATLTRSFTQHNWHLHPCGCFIASAYPLNWHLPIHINNILELVRQGSITPLES